MRQLALFGLVVSMLLGGIAIAETDAGAHSRRTRQDRSLQAAVSSEISLFSTGEQQMTTATSLMLDNPAVRQLLSDRVLSPPVRHTDVADATLGLATIQRLSVAHLSAVCLDDGQGHQLACGPTKRAASFPLMLDRRFLTLADNASQDMLSSVFASPVSGQLSVAFLAPLRMHGRMLGLIHLDLNVTGAQGSSPLVHDLPGVIVQLGTYEPGRVLLDGPASMLSAAGLHSPLVLPVSGGSLAEHPRTTLDAGHRAMAAALPLSIGGVRRRVAIIATDTAANPTFLNTWTTAMLLVIGVAILALLGSVIGLVLSNRRVRWELTIDPLTGLRNRRALIEELTRVCQRASEEEPAFLWFFDLNGFKSYNDSFGHVAGDILLGRLGARLRLAVSRYGVAYRLGGDEFCVLIAEPVENPLALFQEAREALGERGGAFTVSAAAGTVELPRETSDPTQALRLADQHMYREKATSRGGAAELITAVLHAALAQRHPELGDHCDDVAGDVELLARAIDLDEDVISLVVKAGDLHDVGKLGIPDEIIAKPGPLNETEWAFMKQHTVMGEKIIAAAGPSLQRIGPLVRSSHERWDGKGYPDGLAGEEIPLGARIITICDSFSAMRDERVYKEAMSLEDALAELRRCAASQFDPRLVDVFCRLVEKRTASAHERSATG